MLGGLIVLHPHSRANGGIPWAVLCPAHWEFGLFLHRDEDLVSRTCRAMRNIPPPVWAPTCDWMLRAMGSLVNHGIFAGLDFLGNVM